MDKQTPLSTRGREFTGIVISDKMNKTVTVEWERRRYLPKYERYQKRRTRVKAHNPVSINAEKGDTVIIKETRPISKTKNFLVISIVKKHNVESHVADKKQEKKEEKAHKEHASKKTKKAE
jgi:small subunit ribosomal protein S17